MPSLEEQYPWTSEPLIVTGPLRPYATAPLASAVSHAGGIGMLSFIPGQTDKDLVELEKSLGPLLQTPPSSAAAAATKGDETSANSSNRDDDHGDSNNNEKPLLPIGIGYLLHSAPFEKAHEQIAAHRPAVVWLFAPGPPSNATSTLRAWATMTREASPASRVWVQVGSVADALDAIEQCGGGDNNLTLVAQGVDAGGHGLAAGASIVTLLPEIKDALAARGHGDNIAVLAAGGIMDGRAGAAAMALGADGVVLGSRILASEEVAAPPGFRESILAAEDGGQSTVRTLLFDQLRGTKLGGENGWPLAYNGRGLKNVSSKEEDEGVEFEELKSKFEAEQKEDRPERFGAQGRNVTYVGTGVGLVKKLMPAKDIIEEVRTDIVKILHETNQRWSTTHGHKRKSRSWEP